MRIGICSLIFLHLAVHPCQCAEPEAGSPIKQVAPGIFEIGKVLLNKSDRSVTIPASINMAEGTVEYLLVSAIGKTHESVLRTEAEPQHIHLAMLLLGAKGRGTNDFPADKSNPPPGDRVKIEVRWNSAKMRLRAEELVFDRATKAPMPKVGWIYNGSQMSSEGFAAQQIGSIISLIDDPDALINNPSPRRDDDDNWRVNGKALQSPTGRIDVILILPKTAARSRNDK